jgi:hypothetical protein
VTFVPLWSSTLYHIKDLPFNPKEFGCTKINLFTNYMKEFKVRDPSPAPEKGELAPMKNMDKNIEDYSSYSPAIEDFLYEETVVNSEFTGGESQGLKKLQNWLFE